MRSHFDRQLEILNQELTEMGALCDESITMVVDALTNSDAELAAQAKAHAKGIDQHERDIEARCLRLLLQQQPVAKDLRQISAALKMITDMERIGDQTEDIADIIPHLNGHAKEQRTLISAMAQATIRMVTGAVDAYVRKDVALAEKVLAHDDIVDDYFRRSKEVLIDMIAKEPADGEFALDLLMISKYFERIGDHATNIAEWVIFSITGVHKSAN